MQADFTNIMAQPATVSGGSKGASGKPHSGGINITQGAAGVTSFEAELNRVSKATQNPQTLETSVAEDCPGGLEILSEAISVETEDGQPVLDPVSILDVGPDLDEAVVETEMLAAAMGATSESMDEIEPGMEIPQNMVNPKEAAELTNLAIAPQTMVSAMGGEAANPKQTGMPNLQPSLKNGRHAQVVASGARPAVTESIVGAGPTQATSNPEMALAVEDGALKGVAVVQTDATQTDAVADAIGTVARVALDSSAKPGQPILTPAPGKELPKAQEQGQGQAAKVVTNLVTPASPMETTAIAKNGRDATQLQSAVENSTPVISETMRRTSKESKPSLRQDINLNGESADKDKATVRESNLLNPLSKIAAANLGEETQSGVGGKQAKIDAGLQFEMGSGTATPQTTGAAPSMETPVIATPEMNNPLSANTEMSAKAASAANTSNFRADMPSVAFDQIVQKAVLQFEQGQSQMKIDLKPDYLGHVKMEISTENQQVVVRVMAEHPMVKEMIEANLSQLKADLNQHGLQIERMDVEVADHSAFQREAEEQRARQAANNGRINGKGDPVENEMPEVAPEISAPTVNADGRISFFA